MGESARKRHKTQAPPLSAREIRFCQLYADSENATRSYIDADLPHKSEGVASEMGRRLLRKVEIRRYIRKLQDDAAEAAGVSTEYIARGFKRAVDADVTRLLGPDGEMLPPSQWPEEVRLCITRIEVEELTEMLPDPDTRRKRKVAVGTKWKVWLENKTECRKVLAQWKRMLATDKAPKEDEMPEGEDGDARAKLAKLDAELASRQTQSGGDRGPAVADPGSVPVEP